MWGCVERGVLKVEVRTAGGGWKMRGREKEEGGGRERLAAHSTTAALFLNTKTTCLVFTYQSLFSCPQHTPYIKPSNGGSCQRVRLVSSVFICRIFPETKRQSIKHPGHQSVFDYTSFIRRPISGTWTECQASKSVRTLKANSTRWVLKFMNLLSKVCPFSCNTPQSLAACSQLLTEEWKCLRSASACDVETADKCSTRPASYGKCIMWLCL